jgi:hypothetical protein
MNDSIANTGAVRICPTDNGVRYEFTNRMPQNWRRNGLAALIAGLVTLSGTGGAMWFAAFWHSSRTQAGVSSVFRIGSWILYGLSCLIGIAASIPFFVWFVQARRRGGRARLSLADGVVHVGHFFGGEWMDLHIPAEKITHIVVEPLRLTMKGPRVGRIHLTTNFSVDGHKIDGLIVAEEYPPADLRRVADDLRQRLNVNRLAAT